MRLAITFSIFVTLLVGCETGSRSAHRQRAAMSEPASAEFRRQIEAIPIGQPVSQSNADILASIYWRRFYPICGAVYPVRDNGNYWAAHVVAGYVPVDMADILIEKETGTILTKGLPTITNWSELYLTF